eukprot:723825-Rhodomonas_salina.1
MVAPQTSLPTCLAAARDGRKTIGFGLRLNAEAAPTQSARRRSRMLFSWLCAQKGAERRSTRGRSRVHAFPWWGQYSCCGYRAYFLDDAYSTAATACYTQVFVQNYAYAPSFSLNNGTITINSEPPSLPQGIHSFQHSFARSSSSSAERFFRI